MILMVKKVYFFLLDHNYSSDEDDEMPPQLTIASVVQHVLNPAAQPVVAQHRNKKNSWKKTSTK
jgi:hypothetical protein